MRRPVSNRILSRILIISFFIIIASQGCLTTLCFLPSSYLYLNQTLTGSVFSSVLVFCVTCMTLLQVVLEIAVVPMFLVWFYRVYENLHRAQVETDHQAGAAVGWWFVPIPNLFYPYRIAKEIWYKTQKTYTTDLAEHGWIRAWWIFFWFSLVFIPTMTLYRIFLYSIPVTVLVLMLVRTAALVPTIVLIWKISSFEERFLEQTAYAESGQTGYTAG